MFGKETCSVYKIDKFLVYFLCLQQDLYLSVEYVIDLLIR